MPPPPAVVPSANITAPINCVFASFDTVSNECRINSGLLLSIQTIVASPNLGLITKMTSFLWAVDDLAYFNYHQQSYDSSFEFSAAIAWEVTNQKWMIPVLEQVYSSIEANYNSNIPTQSDRTPISYAAANEDAYFLRGTSDIWLSSLPFTIGSFIILSLTRRIFSKTVLARLLARFEFPCFLLVNIIGENVQYLSFRCFSQTYQLIPIGNTIVTYINLSVCFTVLFVVVFWSVAGYLILSEHLDKHRHLLFEGFTPSKKIVFYLSIVLILRVVNGAIHSLLYSNKILQISLLSAVQLVLISMTNINRRSYLTKTLFTMDIVDGVLRLALHSVLLLEVLACTSP